MKDGERAAFPCVAPSCHQWDGTDTCTCQRQQALTVLQRVVTALPVLKAMLGKEGLAGLEVADELMADAHAVLSARAASPQSGEPVKPQARLVTFDEFVQYGIDHGANVVNGMPWSFMFNGHAVTHENDDLYLIGTPSIPFRRGEVLVATAFDHSRLIQVLQPPVRAAAPQAALSDEVLMRAIADTAGCGHPWASRALSNFRAARKAEFERGEESS